MKHLQKLFFSRTFSCYNTKMFLLSNSSYSFLLTSGNYYSTLFLWIQLLWIPHINGLIQHLSFWLISLSIMPSRFIHLTRFPSFLSLSKIPLYLSYFVYSSVHGHFGCFHSLAIVWESGSEMDGRESSGAILMSKHW